VKPILIWILVIGVLLVGFALYRFRGSGSGLNVEPQAAEEIEKAKRR
jgi:hypothetical protein